MAYKANIKSKVHLLEDDDLSTILRPDTDKHPFTGTKGAEWSKACRSAHSALPSDIPLTPKCRRHFSPAVYDYVHRTRAQSLLACTHTHGIDLEGMIQP